jgi:uncharacterized iron-regulated protein
VSDVRVPAPEPEVPLAAGVFPLDGDPEAHARRVAEAARGARVLYLGEVHDNPHHHAHQRRVLETLLALGQRPILAFEMLPREEQAAVEAALREARSAPALGERLGWGRRGWPDFAMYWPLFELAQRHALPVIAADLHPDTARRIGREGLAALGQAGAPLASRLPPDAAREAAIARTIQEAHCNLLPAARLPAMVESWHARNVTMARGLVEALEGAAQAVVIAGRGHQSPGGLPDQLEALLPGVAQVAVDFVEVGAEPERGWGRGVGTRLVWLTPAVTRPDPCEDLRRRLGR